MSNGTRRDGPGMASQVGLGTRGAEREFDPTELGGTDRRFLGAPTGSRIMRKPERFIGLLIGPNERYEIEKHIGSGGYGLVFRGKDRKLGGAPRAIKIIPFDGNDERNRDITKRVEDREVTALMGVHHPHVLPLNDWGLTPLMLNEQEGAGVFMVTPYIADSDTLEQHIERFRPVPWEAVHELFRQVAAAVAALHRTHPIIIHRDLKTANVLFQGEVMGYPYGFTYLLDFGSAVIEEPMIGFSDSAAAMSGGSDMLPRRPENVTRMGVSHPLTPGVAPPEWWDRDRNSRPSYDVFGLGVILFELIAGQPPDESGGNQQHFEEAIRKGSYPHLPDLRRDCPGVLDRHVRRMLANEPQDRFQDAIHAWQAVDQVFREVIFGPRVVSTPKPRPPSQPRPIPQRPASRSMPTVGQIPWGWVGIGIMIAIGLIALQQGWFIRLGEILGQ